jgi:hypothetical protein
MGKTFQTELSGKSVANGETVVLLELNFTGKLHQITADIFADTTLFIDIDNTLIGKYEGALSGSEDLNLEFRKLKISYYNNSGAAVTTKNMRIKGEYL